MKAVFIVLASLFFSIGLTAYATFESSSANFKATDQNVSDTGGDTTSTSFRLYQNAGQTSVGESSSSNFKILAGVLYWTSPSPAASAAPAPQASPAAVGGGGVTIGGVSYPTATPATPTLAITPKPPFRLTCDFNNDGLCNIIDLSILLYWYGKTGPEIVRYDLDQDGIIDLKDISILFYDWKE